MKTWTKFNHSKYEEIHLSNKQPQSLIIIFLIETAINFYFSFFFLFLFALYLREYEITVENMMEHKTVDSLTV